MARKYSVYNRRTDQPIVIHATAAECSEALGIEVRTFYKQITRTRQGMPPKKYEIFTDDEDEDDVDGEE